MDKLKSEWLSGYTTKLNAKMKKNVGNYNNF